MHIGKRAVSAAAALCMTAISFSAMPGVTADAADIYGDVNNDGVVDIGDVISLSKYLNGMVPTSSINVKYSDVDRNMVIDVNDSKTIMNRLIGLVTSLPYSESGITSISSSCTFPADDTRNYVKYNCSTGQQSTYTLNKASAASAAASDNDDRIIDSSANAQCIVYLSYTKSDGDNYRGTGFIIDDHVIATAAHTIYSEMAFNTNYTIRVYNVDGDSRIATYHASELHVLKEYVTLVSNNIKNDEFDYDYGLIYVEEDLSAYGKMALGNPANQFSIVPQDVYVSGFPSEVDKTHVYSRYYDDGRIRYMTPERIFYTCTTSGGDSGGPVYVEYTLNGSTFRSAIGIHTYGYGVDSDVHGGTRITLPLLRFYNNNPNIG